MILIGGIRVQRRNSVAANVRSDLVGISASTARTCAASSRRLALPVAPANCELSTRRLRVPFSMADVPAAPGHSLTEQKPEPGGGHIGLG